MDMHGAACVYYLINGLIAPGHGSPRRAVSRDTATRSRDPLTTDPVHAFEPLVYPGGGGGFIDFKVKSGSAETTCASMLFLHGREPKLAEVY